MSVADLSEKGTKQPRFHCKRVLSSGEISFPKRELGCGWMVYSTTKRIFLDELTKLEK
jgi:hypothetical protein